MEQTALQRTDRWQLTKLTSKEIYNNLPLIVISGHPVSISTGQENCIREDQYQLSSLVKGQPDFSKAWTLIELCIIEIFEFYGRDLSPNLIQSTARQIYKNYYWLKLTEMKLFVERMKSGYYPQMHNLSPAVLMERLANYCEESLELRIQISESQSKEENFIPMSEQQKQDFHLFAEKLANKTEKEMNLKSREFTHRNADQTNQFHKENDFCLQWLNDRNANIEPIDEQIGASWYQLFFMRNR